MSSISLNIAKKKINDFNSLNKRTELFINNNYLLLKRLDAKKYNLPLPLSDFKENILILNKKEKCNICGNTSFFRINSNFICWNHLVDYK